MVGIDSLAGPSEVVVVADGTASRRVRRRRPPRPGRARPRRHRGARHVGPRRRRRGRRRARASCSPTRRAPAEIEATLLAGGRTILVDDAVAGDGRGQRDRARAPRAHDRRSRRAAAARAQRRRGVPRAVVARGASATTSPGVNHVLPTARTARFASALRVDTFRKHMHVVRVDARTALDARRRARRGARRRPRVSPRTPQRSTLRRAASRSREDAPMSAPVAPRDDLRVARGLPLAAARRRRCGSTPTRARIPPPAEFVDRWLDELRAAPLNRYPDRGARELRDALGQHLGQPPERLFCANGSNEVLQTLLLTYGGPGRRAAMFEPTYALHSHIARHHRHRGGRRGAARRLLDRSPTPRARSSPSTGPTIVFVCSPNNPTGTVETGGHHRGAARRRRDGLVVVDEAYGEFAPRSALELVRDDGRARRRAHVLEGVVDGRAAARLRGRAAVGGRGAREGRAAVPPRGQPRRSPGRVALELGRRDGRPRRAARRRARAGCSPSSRRDRRRHRVPVGRQLRAVPRRTATATRSGSARRPRRARARLLALAPPRRSVCVSPSARPRRTTRSSPRSARRSEEVAA